MVCLKKLGIGENAQKSKAILYKISNPHQKVVMAREENDNSYKKLRTLKKAKYAK